MWNDLVADFVGCSRTHSHIHTHTHTHVLYLRFLRYFSRPKKAHISHHLLPLPMKRNAISLSPRDSFATNGEKSWLCKSISIHLNVVCKIRNFTIFFFSFFAAIGGLTAAFEKKKFVTQIPNAGGFRWNHLLKRWFQTLALQNTWNSIELISILGNYRSHISLFELIEMDEGESALFLQFFSSLLFVYLTNLRLCQFACSYPNHFVWCKWYITSPQ